MPKLMSLPELFITLHAPVESALASAAGAAAPEKPNQFLFLLGTDTKFKPKPTTAPCVDYLRGETLSYAAQLTVATLGETGEITSASTGAGATAIENPLSYSSESVDVINGPSTLGAEVGDRIARGIFLGLRAAATGKTKLQITAHSRGAVEAILIMHELDRIKIALRVQPTKTLKAIMLESNCLSTQAAVKALFIAEGDESADDRVRLAERLDHLEVNPFLIDPVPGDTVYMFYVIGVPFIGWHNDNFYKKPPCAHYELLLCANERTTCFYPIVPKDMTPTIIPGHHGSASGNPFDQQKTPVSPDERAKTTGIQDLVLYKWLRFQQEITGAFGKRDAVLDLAHPELDAVANAYLCAEDSIRTKLLIDTYSAVHKQREAYERFNNTSYAVLQRHPAADGDRNIHNGSNALTSLSRITPAVGAHFVNKEHAILALGDSFSEFATIYDAEFSEQLAAIPSVFNTMMALDTRGAALRTSISAANGVGELFFNGLSALVDLISQKYLRNNLSQADKSALIRGIKKPFELLASAILNPDLQAHEAVFQQCQSVLQDSLKRTIETHYHSLEQQYTALQQQVNLFLKPQDVFSAAFAEYLDDFAARMDNDPLLIAIHTRLTAIESKTITNVEQAIAAELQLIEINTQLDEGQKVACKKSLCSDQYRPLLAHFEAHQNTLEEYLLKMQTLHDATRELGSSYPALSGLLGAKTPDVLLAQITAQGKGLKAMAGKLLHTKEHDLRIKPESVSTEFFTIATNKAIKFGALSPDARNLAVAQHDIALSRAQIAVLDARITQKDRDILTLRQEIAVLDARITQKDRDTLTLRQEIAVLVTGITQMERDTQTLSQEIATQDGVITQRARDIRALHSPVEANNTLLINKKLIPLTKNYIGYLITQARRYHADIPGGNMPDLPDLNDTPENPAYHAIKTKYEHVRRLYAILTNESLVLPSTRLDNFTRELPNCRSALKSTDRDWINFAKACATALAIITTGIIPGLLVLAAYSATTGHSPRFFNQSNGGQYVAEAEATVKVIAGAARPS